MNTNYAMLRKFSWATNALWPEDLAKRDIPAAIILSENDEIVPTAAICDLFQDFNKRQKHNEKKRGMLRTHVLPDCTHGNLFLNECYRRETVNTILDLQKVPGDGQEFNFWEEIRYTVKVND